MSFIEKNLSANEQIIYKGKIHWYVYLRGVILIILALLTHNLSEGLSALLFALGLVVLVGAIALTSSSEYAITNKRVILKTGILKRKFIELQLNKSEGMRIEQGIMGRILGFGTIRITSAGVTESFNYLSKPYEFKKQVNNAVEGSFGVNFNPATI